MIRVRIAMKVTVVQRASNAFLAFNIVTAENGRSSHDRFVGDLSEKVYGSSDARATLDRGPTLHRDVKAFKEAAAHCVSAK